MSASPESGHSIGFASIGFEVKLRDVERSLPNVVADHNLASVALTCLRFFGQIASLRVDANAAR